MDGKEVSLGDEVGNTRRNIEVLKHHSVSVGNIAIGIGVPEESGGVVGSHCVDPIDEGSETIVVFHPKGEALDVCGIKRAIDGNSDINGRVDAPGGFYIDSELIFKVAGSLEADSEQATEPSRFIEGGSVIPPSGSDCSVIGEVRNDGFGLRRLADEGDFVARFGCAVGNVCFLGGVVERAGSG